MTGAKVRVGFVGCGRHATSILYPSLRQTDLDLVATASLDEDEARRNARLFGAERAYGGHMAMLESESDLDAVLVAVGPPHYASVLADVLDANLPVWAEKPAAASAAEAGLLQERASNAGGVVCVGYMKRFAPAYELAKAATEQRDFGSPSVFAGKFAMGGGLYPDDYTFLVDNSVHMVDLMCHFMGAVDELSVERLAGDGDQVAYAVLVRFVSAAVGTLHLSTMQSWRAHNERVEITGRGCAVVVDNVTRYRLFRPDGPGEAWEPNFTVPSEANQTVALAGYARELQHFAEVVRDGAVPRVTLEDSHRALGVIDRIYIAGGGVFDEGTAARAW